MTTWFISRHPGAIDWAKRSGLILSETGCVPSLDIRDVQPGDLVVGTLPINLAAAVQAKGARYLHLALELPESARGRELSPDEMTEYGARLEEYVIQKAASASTVADAKAENRPKVMLCIASAQIMQNVLPILQLSPNRLHIVISEDSKAKESAKKIKRICDMLGLQCELHSGIPSSPLPTILQSANGIIQSIRQKNPEAHFILNATGGTKLMSAGFTAAVGPIGEVIYCDTEHGVIEYLQPADHPPIRLDKGLLDIKAHLNIQGLDMGEVASANPEWITAAKSRSALTNYLFTSSRGKRDFLLSKLNGIAHKFWRQTKSGHSVFEATQPFKDSNPAFLKLTEQISKAGLWQIHDESVTAASEDAARYLKGGWLEELMALQMLTIAEQYRIPPAHWSVGVKVRPAASIDEAKDLNELDLVIIWRNKMLVVECKTATMNQKGEDQNITNKLDAIGHYIGGIFTDKWLLSAQKVTPESVLMHRCEQLHIKLFQPESQAEISQNIIQWMGLEQLD